MASRLELQKELSELPKIREVYFQPPPSVIMLYPCIRYHRSGMDVKSANNGVYIGTREYSGVVIDRDPDSEIPDELLKRFPMCRLGKSYVADNLNHFPFTLYY